MKQDAVETLRWRLYSTIANWVGRVALVLALGFVLFIIGQAVKPFAGRDTGINVKVALSFSVIGAAAAITAIVQNRQKRQELKSQRTEIEELEADNEQLASEVKKLKKQLESARKTNISRIK